LPLFAPTRELLTFWKASKKDQTAQDEYTKRFKAAMQSKNQTIDLWLIRVKGDITLNCYEATGFCHRHIVGEIIKAKRPELWGGEVVSVIVDIPLPSTEVKELATIRTRSPEPLAVVKIVDDYPLSSIQELALAANKARSPEILAVTKIAAVQSPPQLAANRMVKWQDWRHVRQDDIDLGWDHLSIHEQNRIKGIILDRNQVLTNRLLSKSSSTVKSMATEASNSTPACQSTSEKFPLFQPQISYMDWLEQEHGIKLYDVPAEDVPKPIEPWRVNVGKYVMRAGELVKVVGGGDGKWQLERSPKVNPGQPSSSDSNWTKTSDLIRPSDGHETWSDRDFLIADRLASVKLKQAAKAKR